MFFVSLFFVFLNLNKSTILFQVRNIQVVSEQEKKSHVSKLQNTGHWRYFTFAFCCSVIIKEPLGNWIPLGILGFLSSTEGASLDAEQFLWWLYLTEISLTKEQQLEEFKGKSLNQEEVPWCEALSQVIITIKPWKYHQTHFTEKRTELSSSVHCHPASKWWI